MRDAYPTAPKLLVTQLHLFGEAGSDPQQFNWMQCLGGCQVQVLDVESVS